MVKTELAPPISGMLALRKHPAHCAWELPFEDARGELATQLEFHRKGTDKRPLGFRTPS
jgi:hypothetical protein